ncbi:hypothetical protein, partial [Pseudomonas lurida]|uniref:hypothetical protein n=1 Tax=Pseudomonas lurida TaxID=244566 RepID=UPI001F19D4BA
MQSVQAGGTQASSDVDMLGQTIDARLSWSDPVLSRFTLQGTMKDAASSIIYEAFITIMPVITMMT